MSQDKKEFPLPTSIVDQENRKTANHLPKFFRSDSNKKFLGGTLDPLNRPGKLERINAYIGRRDVLNYKFDDNYLQENSTPRQYYQLEPAFVKENQVNGDVEWYADYIDYINTLRYFGANVGNHSKLNKQEAYTWNPHINWDMIVNYREYYWLPNGPDSITIYGNMEDTISTYTITSIDQGDNVGYVFSPDGLTVNPMLELYRGVKYRFEIDTPGKFFAIKTVLGANTSNYFNIGVSAQAVDKGVIEFEIPVEAPDMLYYQDIEDVETFGTILIRDIQENSKLDVEKEILGKKFYTANSISTQVDLINGLKLKFRGKITPAKYAKDFWYVEGVGDKIKLVNASDIEAPAMYGSTKDQPFDDQPFDTVPWENADNYPTIHDYVVINRSSRDRNSWTKNNRWFNIRVLELTAKANAKNPDRAAYDVDQTARATRPIIEFEPDTKLFNHGYYSRTDVDLVDDVTVDVFSTIEGTTGYYIDGEPVLPGYKILFTADTDILVKGKIYEVKLITAAANRGLKQLTLQEIDQTDPQEGENVYVKRGKKYKGSSFHYDNGVWKLAQKKSGVNQAPLFDLFDNNGISYSDSTNYPFNTFGGNRIFGYKVGTGTADKYLGFPLVYRNINNVGDITFEFDLQKGSWTYLSEGALANLNPHGGFLRKLTANNDFEYSNGWIRTNRDTEQNVIRILQINSETDVVPIDVYDNSGSITDYKIRVYVNDKKRSDVSLAVIEGIAYIKFTNILSAGDKVVYKVRSIENKNTKGYYEVPLNWQNNSLNDTVDSFTLGEVIDHVRTIVEGTKDFSGTYPGAGNLSDLGPLSHFGRKFMQHTGPMGLSSFLLVDKDANIIKALRWTARKYSDFKKEFLKIALSLGMDGAIHEVVDGILAKYSFSKSINMSAFYYSDMVPVTTDSIRRYEITDTRFPSFVIDSIFDPTANTQRAVLVYHNDQQLIYGKDYYFDADDAFVTITATTSIGDIIIVKDYQTTNGNYVPFTPSKLGLYPIYEPTIYKDDTYNTPTWVIQGHDGSITKAYGEYGDEITELEYRDAVILELEKRIFNNSKIKYDPSIFNIHDIIGGYYRRGDFTKKEINDVLLSEFLRWNSIPSFDFNTNTYYIEDETFTYNYNQATAPNQTEMLYGFWRGIYKYFYDTDRPHTHPWEMQGFSIKPTWWDEVYGLAPYTSENKILWDAIEQGIINDPVNTHTNIKYARPGISGYLPVDDAGNLLSPLLSGLALNFTSVNGKGKYAFGDQGPVETAWRKSSEYPFAAMIACSILRGSEFIGKMWDRFTIKRNIAGQIYLTTSNKKVRTADLLFANEKVNGITTITSGLANIVEEYVFSERNESLDEYKIKLRELNVKLSYRLGGFSSKEKIKVLLDSRSPNASGTIFLPPENYKIFFNKSAPVETINYSGVVIEKRSDGFLVRGYDNERNYFEILPPLTTANDATFTVGGISESFVDWTAGKYYSRGQVINVNVIEYYRAKVSHTASATFSEDSDKWVRLPALPIVGGQTAIHRKKFSPNPIKIPYGTTFFDIQSVVDFLLGYQERLKTWGFQFDDFSNDLSLPFNWLTSAKEFLFWTLHNWAAGDDNTTGAVITLSPAANNLKFKPTINASVDNLDADFYDYSIFKANGQPLKPDLKNIYREDNGFEIKPSNTTNDGVFHIRTNLVYKEHVILFDNTSIFGDVIYDVVPGYRQGRLKLLGFKTTKWDGGFTAPGFLYDEAKILTWQPDVDYNIGDIVQYQNYYFSSTKKIYGKTEFNITDGWKQLDEAPSAQLIPNFDYKVEQFRDFYNLESSNFDENQQSLARHIIGYQPRQYFDDIIIDDVSQYKFYQGFIKEKGTLNSVTKLFDALRASGFSSIELKEEWAFKVGDFGASDAYTELEFPLDEAKVLYNPQNINLTVNPTDFEDLTIYNIPTNNVDIRPREYDAKPFKMANLDFNQNDYGVFKYKVAGYVRDEDVDHIVYDEASLLNYDITLLDNGDNIWLGNTDNGDWDVFEYTNTGIQIEDWNIVENTITLICSEVVRLKKDDIIVLKNIDLIEGIYKIQRAYNNIIEVFSFNTTVYKIDEENSSFGIIYLIESARFKNPSELSYRKYKESNVRGRKAWVDNDLTNRWVTLENVDAFQESEVKPDLFITNTDQLYGYEVKISENKLFMFVGAPKNTGGVPLFPDAGKVLVYNRPDTITDWAFLQTLTVIRDFSASNLTGNEMFGASIDCTGDGKTLVIGAPNFGNLKSNYRGNFSATGPADFDGFYNRGDVVRYNGKLYECQKYIKNSSITDTTVWRLAEEIYKASVIETGSNLTGQGAVFVYEYDELGRKYDRSRVLNVDSTNNEQVIGSYDPKENEHFGSTVKISPEGEWLFVSSKNYWIPNPSFLEDSSKGTPDVGRVQIFRKGDEGWKYNVLQPIIRGDQIFSIKRNEDSAAYSSQVPGRGSQFGYDIDYQVINGTDTLFPNKLINLNVLAISAPFLGAGAVYLLTRYDGEFTFELSQVIDSTTIVNIDKASTFTTSDYYLNNGDLFGYSLAFRQESLTIACPNDDNSGINVGSVYHFDFTGLDSSNNFYTLRQIIVPPMGLENERFGTNVSISPSGKVLAVSAIGGNAIVEVNFDETAERFIGNDSTVVVDILTPTIFDEKGTSFYDDTPYTGAVYVFNKFGEDYIFADKLRPSDELLSYDNFGYSIGVDDNCIAVGTPNRMINNKTLGSVFIFDYNTLSWSTLASESNAVDINKFKKAFIYDTKENVLLDNLDFIDPAKGRIPGIADQELRYQTYYDPAIYEFGIDDEVAVDQSTPWTDEHVGELWWDLSKVKFTWYEQGTSTYKTNNWGRLFPGSSVDIYEWVETIYLPSRWAELADTEEGMSLGVSGTPKDVDDFTYSTKFKYDPVSGSKTTLYYYWVKNKTIVPRNSFRTLAASDIANLILDPKSQGYKFISITGESSLAVVNIGPHLKDTDISFNVQFYQTEDTDLLVHREYALIAQDDADAKIPPIIENKWFDSLIGSTAKGQRVPDTRLNVRQRYGSSNDPRQSWFINRYEALKQTFEYVNSVLAKVQIVDEVNFTNLNKNDPFPVLASTIDLVCEIDDEIDVLEELKFVIIAGVRPAKISLIISEGKVANVLIDDSGYGYKTSPVITVTGTGSGAQLKATLDGEGRVVSIEIVKAGLGYDTNNTTVIVRNFTVLVKTDSEAGGGWSLQSWDNLRQRWNRAKTQAYDVRRYWSYKDWYAIGYNSGSKIDYQVESTKDLNGLPILPGELVKIKNVGLNNWLLLKKKTSVLAFYSDFTEEYEVVGKQNATIEFSDKIYNLNRDLGFDTKFTFDLNLYDQSPTLELRIMLESLRDDILIDTRRIEYVKTFFNNVHYALHEHLYVDWVFKTSFLKVHHSVGSLKQRLNFQSDVLDSYQQFVEEAKPYKSKIREFVSSYDSIDMSNIGVTDFDLPSYYDYNTGRIERVTESSALIDQYPWNHWVDNHTYELTDIILVEAGNYYTTKPKVIISGGGGTGAKATAYIANSKVFKIVIDNPGSGYTTVPTIFISGGNGDREEYRARAYARIGNTNVRTNRIAIAYDRITSSYVYTNFNYTDTFTGVAGKSTFKLTYAPEPEKNKFKIYINGIEIFGSQFDVSISEVLHDSYTALEGFITFKSVPSVGSIIIVEYYKNIRLYSAADRINYAYNPTSSQYGKDLGLLMTGVDYGGVQLTSIDFEISGGWDVIPWDVTSWDSVIATNDDVVTNTDGTTRNIPLGYTPASGEIINVYLTYDVTDSTDTSVWPTGHGKGNILRDAAGKKITKTIRIDDPIYDLYDGSTEQSNGQVVPDKNVIMKSFVGNGTKNHIMIPTDYYDFETNTYKRFDLLNDTLDGFEDLFTFRKSTSEGTILPTDRSLIDSFVEGGNLAYTTATGVRAEEIIIDGDGLVTQDTSHGPEELIQGQVVDTLEINVFHAPSSGSPNIIIMNYVGNGVTDTFAIKQFPSTAEAMFVIVDGRLANYQINYETNTVTLDSVPPLGAKIAFMIGDTGGYDVTEKSLLIGDGSTQLFLTSARYNNGNVSGFITINGIPSTFTILESDDSYEVNGNVVIRFNVPPEDGDVIQVMLFNGLIKKWSEIRTQFIECVANQTEYTLQYAPGVEEPFSSMAFVIMNNDFLQAPDYEYFDYDGSDLVIPDLRYPAYTLIDRDVNVYKNGVKLTSVVDYVFRSETSSVKLITDQVRFGDRIVIEIIKNADFRIIGDKLIIDNKNFLMNISAAAPKWMYITTFTNHDILRVKTANSGFVFKTGFDLIPYDISKFDVITNLNGNGIVDLPRTVSDLSGVFVAFNRKLLSPNIDYVVLDNRRQIKVLLPDVLTSNDFIQIITFNPETVRPSYGFKIFKDMINRHHYKRLDSSTTTFLKKELRYTDTSIEVYNGSLLPVPNRTKNIPGVIIIDNERIEYLVKRGNKLSQLRRGTLGTGVKEIYSVGTEIQDIGQLQSLPYIDNEEKQILYGNGSKLIFDLDYVPTITNKTNWYRETTTNVNAGKFVIGNTYIIVSLGNTDFTRIGAAANLVGYMFVATGTGSGTGVARTPSIPINYGQCDQIEVFVSGRRLRKNPMIVYDPSLGQDSYYGLGKGEKYVEAEFSVDGVSKQIRFTIAPESGSTIVIVRKTGRTWQKMTENSSLVFSTNDIAKFLTEKQVNLPK